MVTMRPKGERRPAGRLAALIVVACLFAACGGAQKEKQSAEPAAPAADSPVATGPLPPEGYRAALSFADEPGQMRAGETKTIRVRVKNASAVPWQVRGGGPDNRYYIAVGNRWFRADGTTLVTSMDGRIGLPENLAPGQETTAALAIKAPQEPGEYVLDLDLVQEQVAWFNERGSETVKTKVAVVR
jgi:hypothetical protein